jgi:hypothetical protein
VALPQPCIEWPTGFPPGDVPTLATHAGLLPGWFAMPANFTSLASVR